MRLLANEAKFLKLTLTLSSLDVGVFGATSNLVDRDLCFKDGAKFSNDLCYKLFRKAEIFRSLYFLAKSIFS